MKKVMVFGTFDFFHKGHEYFIKEAKKEGDFISVVIARDETVLKVKGKYPLNNEIYRLGKVKSYADEVLLGELGDKYKIIEIVKPDVICIGYDQESFTNDLGEEMRKRGLKGKVIKMKAFEPEKYKSSILRAKDI